MQAAISSATFCLCLLDNEFVLVAPRCDLESGQDTCWRKKPDVARFETTKGDGRIFVALGPGTFNDLWYQSDLRDFSGKSISSNSEASTRAVVDCLGQIPPLTFLPAAL